MVGSLASERLLFSTRVLFSATLKTIIDNEKFIFKLTLWISLPMIHLLTVPSSQWIFLTFKKSLLDTAFLRCTGLPSFSSIKEIFIECFLGATPYLRTRLVMWREAGRRPRPSLRWIGSFVIEVQSPPGHHFFVYLLGSRPVLSNWNTIGAVNASHMCYFKFSSHYIKKRNDILLLCI